MITVETFGNARQQTASRVGTGMTYDDDTVVALRGRGAFARPAIP